MSQTKADIIQIIKDYRLNQMNDIYDLDKEVGDYSVSNITALEHFHTFRENDIVFHLYNQYIQCTCPKRNLVTPKNETDIIHNIEVQNCHLLQDPWNNNHRNLVRQYKKQYFDYNKKYYNDTMTPCERIQFFHSYDSKK
jgi:hypothetical protein